jgi:glycine hydroxymethyltransferase
MHIIAAKAVALREAGAPEFRDYGRRVVENAGTLAQGLAEQGLRIVSGGTDNHLFLLDVSGLGLTGADAETLLHAVDLTCNKNLIPYDSQPPLKTSGVRIGTPALTTRGLGRTEMLRLARWIADVLRAPGDEAVARRVRAEVAEVARAFPIYPED